MNPSDISVVIPTLNEAATIENAVRSAIDAGATEIIVCDGGSEDQTTDVAADAGASKIIRSISGRGIQLNAGAVFASREVVLFLHADSLLGESCLQQICDVPDLVWGAFEQHIAHPRSAYRLIEKGNAARVRFRGMAFGDQAIFVRRETYKKVGGFEEIELMEDVAFSRTMRAIAKPVLLPGPVTISARRWEQRGIVMQTLRNWNLQCRYRLGASPRQLAKRYR
ncbi:glycosyl transferase, group 2 family protein [Rhodopirellula maiorica SM1]|uniref:Glycosyl transferase, group 2 family protein n=1 Tax=Rhodopirellula maiorica SM1 TaxID=1265738 RepID=M5RRU4_9BACT|nr:TIGR04283 family arsenosugar biosynthesis glycosyltransferase [Rhodopirellula maiorica]EMI22010.1 glycosyl transferase, group 2 family protein [Rhodopirellula maiorica SM1]